MKKYIKPTADVIFSSTDILTGSIGEIKGTYSGDTPLKAKEVFYDEDDED